MRILHVITDTDRRGAQVFAHDLDTALQSIGHQSHVVALAPGEHGGLTTESVGGQRWSLRGLLNLRQRMKHVDVAIAHGSSTLIACRLASVGTGAVWYYRQISDTWFWANTFLRRSRVRWSMRAAAGVVCLSEPALQDVHDNLGISKKKLAVVPNGVPEDQYFPADEQLHSAARADLGLPADATVIAVVSALVHEKGIDVAVQAMTHLADDVHLVIAGDGPERDAIDRLGQSIAPGRVHLVGQLTNALQIYHAADVVALPSRGGDSMPATLIEAGLCALPVVATDVGSIAEVVDDGDTGFILDALSVTNLATALSRAIDDTQDSGELGQRGRRKMLEQFAIDQVARRWVDVITPAGSA